MVKKLSAEKRALALLYNDQTNMSCREIAGKCGISKSTVSRICCPKEKIIRPASGIRKVGRPRRLEKRTERLLLRKLKRLRKQNINLCVKDLMKESCFLPNTVSPRTISRYLNQWGYKHLQARKKGLLNENDKKVRRLYARKINNLLKTSPDFHTNHVAFYLDGVSFVHKYNPFNVAGQPKSRVWRRRGEGLDITAKGSKELAGGRRLHLMVAVAYGKGVIMSKAYDKMNGPFFANFIKEHLNLCFAKSGPKSHRKRLFVMDNDPCQTSKVALEALEDIECEFHRIPARSPDLNPIENIFHVVKKSLEDEALNSHITKESFENFRDRVIRCLDNLDIDIIDRTILSMPRRISKIIAAKGIRLKY